MNNNTSQTPLDPRSSISSSPGTNTTAVSWSSNSSVRHNESSAPVLFVPNVTNQETTRHWTFTVSVTAMPRAFFCFILVQAFEWVVRDVRKLKEYVEGREDEEDATVSTAENDDFEILKESPMMGDGKFKLEIGMHSKHTLNIPEFILYLSSHTAF